MMWAFFARLLSTWSDLQRIPSYGPSERAAFAHMGQIPDPNNRYYQCVKCDVRGKGNHCWYCESSESLMR